MIKKMTVRDILSKHHLNLTITGILARLTETDIYALYHKRVIQKDVAEQFVQEVNRTAGTAYVLADLDIPYEASS
jgi:hypothetical protein